MLVPLHFLYIFSLFSCTFCQEKKKYGENTLVLFGFHMPFDSSSSCRLEHTEAADTRWIEDQPEELLWKLEDECGAAQH